MKSLLLALIFFIPLIVSPTPDSNSDHSVLTLPVFPKLSMLKGEPLTKELLNLKVNGVPRNIYNVSKIERSLGNYPDMGRDIVLSFMTLEASETLSRGISYFVSDVLREHDSLIILTPLKAYRLKPDNKERVISEIGKILEKDCKSFNTRKIIFENRIRSELKKIGSIMSAGRSLYNNTRHTKVLFRFLNSFPEEFEQYLKFTLVQNFEKFEGVAEQILGWENEKWWIHFNNEDTGEVISGVRKILKLIESAGSIRLSSSSVNHGLNPLLQSSTEERSSGGAADDNYRIKFSRFIKEVRRSLNFRERKFIKNIGSKINCSGICFNSITFNGKEIDTNNLRSEKNSVSELILGDICTNSGGKTLFENNIEKALKEITRHKFTLYHLDFPLYRKDNGISIDLDDKYSLMKGYSYPKVLGDDYIDKIRKKLMVEKCRINDLVIINKRIRFYLEGFERNGDKVGLLKIVINFFDKNGKYIYKIANTLRSSPEKKKIFLSIPIPEKVYGCCNLEVSVTDLIARNTSSSRKDISLH